MYIVCAINCNNAYNSKHCILIVRYRKKKTKYRLGFWKKLLKIIENLLITKGTGRVKKWSDDTIQSLLSFTWKYDVIDVTLFILQVWNFRVLLIS